MCVIGIISCRYGAEEADKIRARVKKWSPETARREGRCLREILAESITIIPVIE